MGDDACTKDGSLDRKGKQAIKRMTGGWKCGILLLANVGFSTVAFSGLEVNLVQFSKSVMGKSNADAASAFTTWVGTSYLFSLLGAFLGDSYWGRYRTCIIFQIPLIIGMITLSLTTDLLFVRPRGCGKIGLLCEPYNTYKGVMFNILIYLIALGSGGPDAVLPALIADQFDEEDTKENKLKASFYGYYFVAENLGSSMGPTILTYLENKRYWVISFWTCSITAFVAYVLLLSGTPRYRHFKPTGKNPISRFSQVIVASMRKSGQRLPSNKEELYQVHGIVGERSSIRRILHTNGFKFFDRAAIITPEDMKLIDEGRTPNSWYLCTVSQVEEVKCVLRLLPIWLSTIFFSVVYTQMLSLFMEQGDAMDKSVFGCSIPPGSIYLFNIITTAVFILLYDNVIIGIYAEFKKEEPKIPSTLQRTGIGLAISVLPMVIAGIVEQQRLKHAHNLFRGKQSSLSILWQIPQFVLMGVAEAFFFVGQMEFFAEQVPDGMKSLGMSLCMSCLAVGSYAASGILTVVMNITSKDGQPGWVPTNLNDGHLDWFFYLIATLSVVNFMLYVICATCFKPMLLEKRSSACEEECLRIEEEPEIFPC